MSDDDWAADCAKRVAREVVWVAPLPPEMEGVVRLAILEGVRQALAKAGEVADMAALGQIKNGTVEARDVALGIYDAIQALGAKP